MASRVRLLWKLASRLCKEVQGMFVDNALEANPVAGFLALMRNFVQGSPVNQDSLVRTNAIATLSYLLQKVIRINSHYLTDCISFCFVLFMH